MERLLLIFIAMGNFLPLLHAVPHQEVNLEKFDESKKNYNEGNSVDDVPQKSGRSIHQTAWSKEGNEDELNSVVKEGAQRNSTNNIGSWDLPKLLKVLLNLVGNRDGDETEETVKSGKDSGVSKNKVQNSNKLRKLIAEASKAENIVLTKQSENQRINEAELDSSSESDSYNSNPFDKPYEQKKQKSGMTTNSFKIKNAEKKTQSGPDNREFTKTEQLIDEQNLQEFNKKQSIDENFYYYNDYYDEDNDNDEFCDSYSSTFSSENVLVSEITTEDSYETGGIEISDEEYLKQVPKTIEDLISEIPDENYSRLSIIQNGTIMQDDSINQETRESFDGTILSNKLSIEDGKDAKDEIDIQYPIDDITGIEMQTEDDINYDNTELDIISSSINNEINVLEIKSDTPEQNVTLTTKDDKIVLEKPEFQNTYSEVTSSYTPLMESTVLQQVADQSFISHEKHIQATTPLIPDDVNFPSKNTELQPQIDESLIQNTILQKTSSNIENTQKPSFEEDFSVSKTSGTIQIRKPVKMNSTFQTENYSIKNQETTQELLQSLPLSSSGEFITYTSEKEQPFSNTSEKEQQFSNTSEKEQQLSITSKVELSNTSEIDKQLSNTFEINKQLSNTSESDKMLSNISESEQQLLNTSEKNGQLSGISETDKQISITSESDSQHLNISDTDQQISSISQNDKKLDLLETDSKNTNLELLELQKDFMEKGEEMTQSESSSLSYTLTKDQEQVPDLLQNVIVFKNEKTQLNADNEAKDLMPDETTQITNKIAYQDDELQKDSEDFSTSQITTIRNNEADENLNINQTGASLLVDEVLNQFSGISVTHEETSKNMEENESDDDYYDFDLKTSSVNSVSESDQNSLESDNTSPIIKHNTNLQSDKLQRDPEKPYDTILQFLYKHSNSSFIQSLKEYE